MFKRLFIISFLLVIIFGCTQHKLKTDENNPNLPVESPVVQAPSRECNFKQLGEYIHYEYPEYKGELGKMVEVETDWFLAPPAADAYFELLDVARQDGIYLVAVSAFRTHQEQDDLFEGKRLERRQTEEERAFVSAPKGHSEHSTGFAVDFNDFENRFAFSPEYEWLKNNAPRYGWELSFPKNNEQNISFEPWHWRYIGKNREYRYMFCP